MKGGGPRVGLRIPTPLSTFVVVSACLSGAFPVFQPTAASLLLVQYLCTLACSVRIPTHSGYTLR